MNDKKRDLKNCMWSIGADDTQYYSSAINDYVASDSQAATDWINEYGTPNNIPNLNEVMDIMRRINYPDVFNQLDMLYWDQVNGTTTFKDARAAVKAAYPKQ